MTADDELERDVAAAMKPVWDDILRAARAVWDQLGGAEGLAQLQADRAQWDVDHPDIPWGRTCDCMCPVAGHDGVCQGRAETWETFIFAGEPGQRFLCQACEAAMAERRALDAQGRPPWRQ